MPGAAPIHSWPRKVSRYPPNVPWGQNLILAENHCSRLTIKYTSMCNIEPKVASLPSTTNYSESHEKGVAYLRFSEVREFLFLHTNNIRKLSQWFKNLQVTEFLQLSFLALVSCCSLHLFSVEIPVTASLSCWPSSHPLCLSYSHSALPFCPEFQHSSSYKQNVGLFLECLKTFFFFLVWL